MAHTKAQKAVSGNRDSAGKRLGIKIFGGQLAQPGNIIVRQRGSRIRPGTGVMMGKDFSIIAAATGKVKYFRRQGKQYVSVIP